MKRDSGAVEINRFLDSPSTSSGSLGMTHNHLLAVLGKSKGVLGELAGCFETLR
jgi:hypothetical protein